MPPRVKTKKDDIVNAAFQVAKNGGVASITAQRVSAALKTSVAPIFREFKTIEELRLVTIEKINSFHVDYIKNYPQSYSEILTYGIAYIHFAKDYPYFFETIMQPGQSSMDERMSGALNFVLNSVGKESGLSFNMAKELFLNIWIYTHGIACLSYKGSLAITEDEERQLLMTAFSAFHDSAQKEGHHGP